MRKVSMLVEFFSCEACPYYDTERGICTYVDRLVEDSYSIPDWCELPSNPIHHIKSCCFCKHYDLSSNLCKVKGVKILERDYYCCNFTLWKEV